MPYTRNHSKRKIDKIDITEDNLTDRGGIALFTRFLECSGIYPRLTDDFGSLRKSRKGVRIQKVFTQLLSNFADGTSFSLSHFDDLAKDEGWRGVLEITEDEACSSHSIKRFFKSFTPPLIWRFRKIFQDIFISKLQEEQPEVIILGIDTMVMDNDSAEKREGVEPTYKKTKGFQPLQLSWDRYIIDAVFRGGSKHSNHKDTVAKMIEHIVHRIRSEYSETVPIILRQDSGFFDQNNLEKYEELGIGYISGGKLYEDIEEKIKEFPQESFREYKNQTQTWDYVEFQDKRGNWKKTRKAIYCSPRYEDDQKLLDFARPDTIIYTNIGVDNNITETLKEADLQEYLLAENLIETYHQRGADELIHRAFKDFGPENLPFKRFIPNAAYYCIMLLAFNLYESFKKDVTAPVLSETSYARTVRRYIFDIAAKIVHTSGQIILKVTKSTWNRLRIDELWRRCNSPPKIIPIS